MPLLKFPQLDPRRLSTSSRRKARQTEAPVVKQDAIQITKVESIATFEGNDKATPSEASHPVKDVYASDNQLNTADISMGPSRLGTEKSRQIDYTSVSKDELHPSVAFEAQELNSERDARLEVPLDGGQMHGTNERLLPAQQEPALDVIKIRSPAFREACTKRTLTEKSVLAAHDEVKELLIELSDTNATHQEKSCLRKGVELLRPVIKCLNFTLNIANPVAMVEPTAVSGLAVIQTVVVMAAAICGAEDALRENIEEFLRHIPIIDLCEDLQSVDFTPEVHQALVLVYGDLLDFYFEAQRILQSKSFIIMLAKSTAKCRLSDITSSFSKHTESLLSRVKVKTAITVTQFKENLLEETIRQLLETSTSREIEIHNKLLDRADDACSWISSDQVFQKWTTLSSDLHCVSLIGSMGNGKTFTTSYVARVLEEMFDRETYFVRPAICCHYCRDDNETNDILNIYRGLVRQLLNKRGTLMKVFFGRYRDAKERLSVDPTCSVEFLSDFLFDVLKPTPGSTKQATYIIIDGLDECATRPRSDLLKLFKKLYDQSSRTKLFLSHRPDENIRTAMPQCSSSIYLPKSKERDYRIVRHIVKNHMENLSEEVESLIVEDLSEKADGCAIWVWLVVEYLRNLGHRKRGTFKRLLEAMPPPDRLAELYVKLFEGAVRGESENIRDLALILEFLTHALRPLTLIEIACAVTIGTENATHFNTIAEVGCDVDTVRTRQLARSFVSIPEADDLDNASVSLVHQSLKEVILRKSPNEWLSDSRNQTNAPTTSNSYGLYVVSESCIRYLLLDDSDLERRTESLISNPAASDSTSSPLEISTPSTPTSVHIYPELWAQSPIVGSFFAGAERVNSWKVRSLARRYRFYDYAIRFWFIHFRECRPAAESTLHTLAIELYKKMSSTDWDDYLQTRNDYAEGCPAHPDALTICCFFGHLDVAVQIANTFEVNPSQFGSALYWASSQGHLKCVELLYSRIHQNVGLCYRARRSPLAAASANGHVACVDFLLRTDAFDVNEQDSMGRTALALAVKGAHKATCLTLLSWQPRDHLAVNLSDGRGWSPLFWAAGLNTSHLASILLDDDRIDLNLIDNKKRTALSWACEESDHDLVKLFVNDHRIRLDAQDSLSRTPLMYAIKSNDLKKVEALFLRGQINNLDVQSEMNLSAQDNKGRNAISWAAAVADPRILQLLLQHAATQANVQDAGGWPPVAWTLDPPGYPQNCISLLPYIKEHINDRDINGSTLLSTAITWKRPEIAKIIIEQTDIDVNSRSNSGRTSLSYAASAGYLDIVKLLVERRGANASIVDGKGLPPLHYAKASDYTAIVDYLDQMSATTCGA